MLGVTGRAARIIITEDDVTSDKRWHDFHFWIEPLDENTRTWIDLFLLDAVIGNTLRNKNLLDPPSALTWLIHRRWGNDDDGHEFKFSCYCNESIASDLNDTLLSHCRAYDTYRTTLARCWPQRPSPYKHEPSSDTRPWREWDKWPEEFFRPWMFFICGLSRTLLELIDSVQAVPSPLTRPDPTNVAAVESFYTEVERRVSKLWRENGHEPFLHQLNAMFGYADIICVPRRVSGMLMSF